MTADELSAEQEEHLVYVMLREQGGIDPGRLGPVIDLAALGLVNAAWRNTCVEDWHAGSRMHDGDMMRVNSHMTWRARQILRRWTAENGLAADGPLSAVDSIPAQDIEWLAVRVYRWLVDPHRKLVTGITLAELAGDDLPQYEDDAELPLGGFAKQAADRGAQFGLARTAAHGALACPQCSLAGSSRTISRLSTRSGQRGWPHQCGQASAPCAAARQAQPAHISCHLARRDQDHPVLKVSISVRIVNF